MKLKNKSDIIITECCQKFPFETAYIRIVKINCSAIRSIECSDYLEKCCFACPAGTNY